MLHHILTNGHLQYIISSITVALTSTTLIATPPDLTIRSTVEAPVQMIHVSDLYRPHNDPDDHWDLACAYSLAWQQDAELLGVFIDHPQSGRGNDPDALSVAQLNYLTGKAVPLMIGSPRWIEPSDAASPDSAAALRGIRALLNVLRKSPRPVVISILGSCRDIAIAGQLAPDLFAAKCAAIYLNAGCGTPDPKRAKHLEWNVQLDPKAYSSIFSLPCPIYWMPCFEDLTPPAEGRSPSREYGTYYQFRQGDILPHASPEMQNFFNYLFLHSPHEVRKSPGSSLRPNWLTYLTGTVDEERLARINAMKRNMWCTGGFLHAVGKTVNRDGTIVRAEDSRDPVFTFDPIQITCKPNGITTWKPGPSRPERYIFHVQDQKRYGDAMTEALKTLVTQLP